MHHRHDAASPWITAAHAVALLLSFVAAAGSIVVSATAQRRSRRRPKAAIDALYEDENGIASVESQARYKRISRLLLALWLLIAAAGLGTSIAYAVRDVFEPSQQHRPTASAVLAAFGPLLIWLTICVQAITAALTKAPVGRFNIGILAAVPALAVCVAHAIEHTPLPGSPEDRGYPHHPSTKWIAAGNSLCAIALLLTTLSIPRTPWLFRDGRPVDGVQTVSALNRITFAWPGPYLSRAWKSKQLDFGDFDVLDAYSRSLDLFKSMEQTTAKHSGGLLKRIIFDHASSFAWQYFITLLEGLCIVLPQVVMYELLLVLERKDRGDDVLMELWMWVAALGIAILVQGAVNNSMWFMGYSRLLIPLRLQLSAMIFSKAMRKKSVQGIAKSDEKDDPATSQETLLGTEANGNANGKKAAEGGDEDNDEKDDLQKMRQGVVNLIGVDANRVGMFALFNNALFGCTIRLSVAFTFLGSLVGWQALLAGIAVQLFFLPVNIFFSKRYSAAQDRLMKVRDRKLAALNEALNGIRQIKFSALEDRWQQKIGAVREDELKAQWRVFVSDTMLLFCWILGPVLLSATSIAVYTLVHGTLPPSIAFTTIAVLGELEVTLAVLPEWTTDLLDAWVSIKRIQAYLDTPDKEDNLEHGENIRFEDATLSWPSDEEKMDPDAFKLHGVSIDFPNDELSVISGRTGSGKSLLLAAILGEVEILNGSVVVPRAPPLHERFDAAANKGNWLIPNAIAYVSQQPWIENRTFRDNILFDLPFDAERYREVLQACSLEQDIATLSDGEQTEIGANGINLSGGQRWRVTLARALYSRAGTLIMDDIFSAVDAHVGRHIFEQALTGKLAQGRTRILVTHHVALVLEATKYEVRLADGKVEHEGFVDDSRRRAILDKIEEEGNVDDVAVVDEPETGAAVDLANGGPAGDDQIHTNALSGAALVRQRTRSSTARRLSRSSRMSETVDDPSPLTKPPAARKFVEDEKREEGRVKLSVYSAYAKASGGIPFWALVLTVFVGYQSLLLLRSWVLRLWTADDEREAAFASTSSRFVLQSARVSFSSNASDAIEKVAAGIDDKTRFYLALYVGLAIVLCFEGTIRYLLVFYGSIKASRRLFNQMTTAVLRAPLRWLDTVPVGRILNRFTSDFSMVDSSLAYYFSFLLYNGLVVVGIVVAAVIVSPFIILISVVLFVICGYYAVYFLAGAREAKRLESTAKSPIFEFFSTALAGVTTVRAFSKAQAYVDQMFTKLDTHGQTLWAQWMCNRWLGWRLTVMGACFAVITALLVVSLKGVDAALGGFALAFTLQYTDAIIWLLRNYTMVELGMNSTERIIEYTQIATEDQGGADVPAAWPTEGHVEVEDLVVSYASDLPPVLKGLTFSVKPNERVGVVGRTGAGKSSLTLALFRFLEASEGTITIDGIDISKIKLHDLRSRLSIIAQDPVLFSGTIRSNLDPFSEHADHELREALERAHLVPASSAASTIGEPAAMATASTAAANGTATPTNINPFASLSSPVSEGGLNLSQGQRQLLCLARAIVARPKVMVLDEATSAVDKGTDALIQRSIREEFSNSTLIVIAHRLSTIADFDRILVMSEGKVAEFGTPGELMGREGGVFRAMVEDSGERETLREVILGNSA